MTNRLAAAARHSGRNGIAGKLSVLLAQFHHRSGFSNRLSVPILREAKPACAMT
jgi:hypothetical protein